MWNEPHEKSYLNVPFNFPSAGTSLSWNRDPNIAEDLEKKYRDGLSDDIQLKQVLIDKVLDLTQRVELLENRRTITIQNLRSKKLRLVSPLWCALEHADQIYVVSSDDVDIYGYGETEYQAMKNFSSDIETLYFDLKDEQKNLGQKMQECWDFLRSIIIEKEHVAT